MTTMKVCELTEKLNRIYKPQPSTYKYWQKSIKPIAQLSLSDITDEVVLDYRINGLDTLSEGTLRARIGYLKGLFTQTS